MKKSSSKDWMARLPIQAIALSICLALPLASAQVGPSDADTTATNTLETVMVTGVVARQAQNPPRASSSMTVINAADLKTRPVADLNDILRDIEGFDMGGGRDDSGQARFTLRGLDADYTLILVDGKRQNSSGDIFPNAYRGYEGAFIPPVEMIERVEVIRGPMATIYGADAIGGVINIITKRVQDTWTGAVTNSRLFNSDNTLGDSNTTNFSLSGPLQPGILGLNVRGSYSDESRNSRTFTPPAQDPQGQPYPYPGVSPPGAFSNRTERSANSTRWSGGFRLSLTPTPQQEFLLDYDLSRQKHDRSASDDDTPETPEYIWSSSFAGYGAGLQRSEREQVALSWFGNWDIGRSEIIVTRIESTNLGRTLPLTLEERIELSTRRDAANDPLDPATKDEVLDWIAQTLLPRANRNIRDTGLVLDARQELKLDRHQMVIGAQVQDRKFNDAVFDALGYGEESFRQWSLFAENDWALHDAFTLTGGLRYDKNRLFTGNLSPRLYAVWQASPSFLLKGGIGTGYKPPKTNDLYNGIAGFSGGNSGPYAGNPDLKPEKTVTSELAAHFTSERGDSANITLFHTRFRDKIEEVYYGSAQNTCRDNPTGSRACANIDPRWHIGQSVGLRSNYTVRYPNNLSEVESRGVEVAGTVVFTEDLSLRSNYTHTRMRVTKGPAADRSRPITGSPARHLFNSTLYWQATPKLDLNLTLYAESSRHRGYNSDNQLQPAYKAYRIVHLGASYRVSDAFTVTTRINNLLDRDFATYDVDWTLDPLMPGQYTPSKLNHYRVTDKARNFWVSLNYRF